MKRYIKGCAIGCGVLVLLGLGLGGSGVWWMARDFFEAADTTEELRERYATVETFTPPVPIAAPADRLRRFIAVRESLAIDCEKFAAGMEQIHRMDRYEDQEDPPKGKMMADIGRTMGAAFGFAQRIGAHVALRNAALMEQEMGLGEYTWLYIVGYYGLLGEEPRDEEGDREGGALNRRIRRGVAGMIRRHLEARESAIRAGADTVGSAATLAQWREELMALEEAPERVPFADGLPADLAAAVAPFRDALEPTFCPHTDDFDLLRPERKGLSVQAR